jgi:hypothetical protein
MTRYGTRILVATFACVAASGCRDPLRDEVDLRICQQTYEFGNFGCARVVGRVLDRHGNVITDRFVNVLLRSAQRDGSTTLGITQTDTTGWFATGVTLMLPPALDSIDLLLRASVVQFGSEQASPAADSVEFTMPLGAVGAVAPVETVTVRLPYP